MKGEDLMVWQDTGGRQGSTVEVRREPDPVMRSSNWALSLSLVQLVLIFVFATAGIPLLPCHIFIPHFLFSVDSKL